MAKLVLNLHFINKPIVLLQLVLLLLLLIISVHVYTEQNTRIVKWLFQKILNVDTVKTEMAPL